MLPVFSSGRRVTEAGVAGRYATVTWRAVTTLTHPRAGGRSALGVEAPPGVFPLVSGIGVVSGERPAAPAAEGRGEGKP